MCPTREPRLPMTLLKRTRRTWPVCRRSSSQALADPVW
jgi:hypothetical protein